MDATIAARLCERLDFEAPSLAAALREVDSADPVRTSLAVIRALRERQSPRFAYTREWVQRVRDRTPAET
ncbi:MAG: hypothetical protein ACOC9P_01035, partial [bacterium]